MLLPHFVVDLVDILVCASLLVLLGHSEDFAVAIPDMLNKVGAVSDECAFNSVDNWAGSLIKTKGATRLKQKPTTVTEMNNTLVNTYRIDEFSPFTCVLHNKFDGDVGAVGFKELAKHLALHKKFSGGGVRLTSAR